MTSTHLSLYVTPDELAMAEKAATIIAAQSKEAIAKRGKFTFAISGGRTPLPLFRLLASPAWSAQIDWTKTVIYWVDERCVSIESEQSNFRNARNELLSHVPVTSFYRMKGEERPQDAAEAYSALLQDHFSLKPGEFPRFDCVLLGVGADGRTASLYPGDPALHIANALVVDVYKPKERLTLTLPVLNNTRCCIILASGKEKHHILTTALNLMAAPVLPAQMVRPRKGALCWIIDEQAYHG